MTTARTEANPSTAVAPVPARDTTPGIDRRGDPRATIADLQRTAGNRAVRQVLAALGPSPLDRGVPPIVHDALASGDGQALDPDTRATMETRFQADLGHVRIHTGPRADESARLLGARAYATGRDIAFRAGQYAPETPAGLHLLAHELAHALQMRGTTATPAAIGEPGSTWEASADRAASAATSAGPATVAPGAPAAVRLAPDPQLADYLKRLSAAITRETSIVGPVDENVVLGAILDELQGLNLTEVDNLGPVAQVVRAKASSDVFVRFLRFVQTIPRQVQARQKATIQHFQVERRGAAGTRGPASPAFAAADVVGRPLAPYILPVLEVGGNVLGFVEGLVKGLGEGLGAKLSEDDRKALRDKLMQSSVVGAAMPALMGVAAAHGIGKEVYEGAKGFIDIARDPVGFARTIGTLVELMISDDGAAVGRALGADMGAQQGDEILKSIGQSAVGFAYDFGKLVGPYVVKVALFVAGVTAAAGIALGAFKLVKVLTDLAKKSKRIQKLLERIKALGKRAPDPKKLPEPKKLPDSPKPPDLPKAPDPKKAPTPAKTAPSASGSGKKGDAPRAPAHPGMLTKPIQAVSKLMSKAKMVEFLAMAWKKNKFLHELARILPKPNDAAKRAELIKLLDSWARQKATKWEKVDGALDKIDPRNPASLSWKKDTLLVERRLVEQGSVEKLSDEVLHELCASATGFPHTARLVQDIPDLDIPALGTNAREYWHAGRLLEDMVKKNGDLPDLDRYIELAKKLGVPRKP